MLSDPIPKEGVSGSLLRPPCGQTQGGSDESTRAFYGTFVVLASVAADGEGEAEISTEEGLATPLGAGDAGSLVGLEVRVVRGEELLLSGTVPRLVAD